MMQYLCYWKCVLFSMQVEVYILYCGLTVCRWMFWSKRHTVFKHGQPFWNSIQMLDWKINPLDSTVSNTQHFSLNPFVISTHAPSVCARKAANQVTGSNQSAPIRISQQLPDPPFCKSHQAQQTHWLETPRHGKKKQKKPGLPFSLH